MGQRAEIRVAEQYRPGTHTGSTVVSIFPTELGWFGLVGRDSSLLRLSFGHRSPDEVRMAVGAGDSRIGEGDWSPSLRQRLEEYAAGTIDSFQDVSVVGNARTRFQRAVVGALRGVGYGETLTYGELAERAGYPKAARAVGRVMATNTVPIVVACHRVVGSGGGLGGFSAPQGISMKQRLLQLEGSLPER